MDGDGRLAAALREAAHPLHGERSDWDPLLERIGDAHLVLLGEATHGTHELYRARAEITKRLVEEKGFVAVAVEADWPDAYRVNRFVRGLGPDLEAVEALADFRRFPAWMWRNADVLDFVGWLRSRNEVRGAADRVGFYGLDLYSLHASRQAVVDHLERIDPAAARRARARYSCFDHYGDPQRYGYASAFDLERSCEDDVVAALVELQHHAAELLRRGGLAAADDLFSAEQNARVVREAERYYRGMFDSRVNGWNLRDRHMADTLDALLAHLSRRGAPARVVVWAHNSHLGDARATEVAAGGELNVGQLARERHGDDVVSLGFTTWGGTVAAASEWDGPVERKRIVPGLPGSYEELFHEVGQGCFYLDLGELGEAAGALREPRLERAIGVVYRPESERLSHYFEARLPAQFDAVAHYDLTRAVEPLERTAAFERLDLPETYPWSV